ncbi:phage tail tape measure protein [Gimesia fumaroli]|uniref:Phage-related minor tail protein n=1 Tax=Gimesia fumaroli TaxID=2527976 RepID=A0A518IKS3_9PLAN|nr:phage tail tape measure protein [Gimesia fumaroli]QDV53696.1 Phage-related minor tail protein [Gimesia fumaroli]
MDLYTKDAKMRKGLANARRHLKAFGGFVKKTGANMVLGGAAIALPFIMALPIFAQFSDKMSEVQAITGATGAEFVLLNDTAKQLGSTTSFSASQVADGMKFLGMAGFETKEIIAGIPAVLNLARAGALELGVAADIASDVGSAFGMAADEIGHLADVIATTATSANTSVEMMGESFKFVAPVAKAAGQSLEETAAAIGLLGNSGIKASMAGTDLKNILIAFVKQKSALSKFGVSAADAQGRIRPLLDVMRELGQATNGLSESEKLAFFMETFGKISGKSALILAGLNSEVDTMRGKLANADGAAARMAKVMDDNLGGSFRGLLSAMEGMAISLIEQVSDPLRDVIGWITVASSATSKWMQENQGLVRTVALLSAGLIIGGSALFLIGGAALLAGAAIGGLSALITGLGAVAGVVVSPVVLISAALVGAVGKLLYFTGIGGKAINWIQNQFSGLGETVGNVFGAIKRAMAAGDYKKAAEILWLGIGVAWLTGSTQIMGYVDSWKHSFLDVWYSTNDAASKYFIDMWADVKGAWEGFTRFIGDTWDITIGGMKKSVAALQEFLAIQQIELKYGDDPSKQLIKNAAIAGVKTASSIANQRTQSEQEAAIADRTNQYKAAVKNIEDTRTGAKTEIDEAAQRRDDAREKKLIQDRVKANAELLAATQALNDAMQEEETTNAETKTEQAAKAALAPGGAIDSAKQSISGGNGDLKTQEGMEAIARLINMSGEGSSEEEQLKELRLIKAALLGQKLKVARV